MHGLSALNYKISNFSFSSGAVCSAATAEEDQAVRRKW